MMECCICLEFVDGGEKCPTCKTQFHSKCIKRWANVDFSCPHCRCPLLPAFGGWDVIVNESGSLVVEHTCRRESSTASVGCLDELKMVPLSGPLIVRRVYSGNADTWLAFPWHEYADPRVLYLSPTDENVIVKRVGSWCVFQLL